jgi:hypothetical protein
VFEGKADFGAKAWRRTERGKPRGVSEREGDGGARREEGVRRRYRDPTPRSSAVARTVGDGLEGGKRSEEPAFGLLKHAREEEEEGGTGEEFADPRRGRCTCIYAVSEDNLR